MPIYPYRCFHCSNEFEVWSNISDLDNVDAKCPECDMILSSKDRLISGRIYFSGEKSEDESFCNALGCVVKNDRHRQEIAKRRDLIAVGDASTESIAKFTDDIKTGLETKRSNEMTHAIKSVLR